MEYESRTINPSKTANLHDNLSYGFTDIGDEWRAWYTAYMRSELKNGMGLDPSVYQVCREVRYELVSDDMTVGSGVSGSDNKNEPQNPAYSVSSTSNITVKASIGSNSVTLSWTAVKGAEEYVVYQYKNDDYTAVKKTAGTSAVISGLTEGRTYYFMVGYSSGGKITVPENSGRISVILYPKSSSSSKPQVRASASKSSVTLSWSAVSGAKKYAVYRYSNGKMYKLTETSKCSVKITKLSPKTKYQYIVRAYVNGKWTTVTKSDIITVMTK